MTRFPHQSSRLAYAGLAAALLLVGGCSAAPVNSTLNSVRQPVVERTLHALDLAIPGGELAASEQARLAEWFAGLDLGYGDKVTLAGGDRQLHEAVAALAAHHGAAAGAVSAMPAPAPYPDQLRVTVSRSRASVPGCPDWSARSTSTLDNATSPGFGCAVNGNLAAMIADPEHLLKGAEGSGETVVMTASKAIATYRALEPTGSAGLADLSSQGVEE